MSARTVFISNKSYTHNYSAAASYGALRFVTIGNYPIFKTNRLLEEIASALAWSRPEDYLLLSGSAVVAGLCVAVWLEMHGSVQLLLWDRPEDAYVLRVVSKSEDIRLGIERARQQIEQTSR